MSKHLKILLGGSPCTHWSIAQKNNRETEPGGLGWELFKNFLIAKEKFKPDYFLYENNKSMAKPIRNQIDIEFNHTYAENMNWELVSSVEEDKGHTKRWLWINKTTGKTEYITRILINSALVSAQNRQRYYWTNIPNVQQPADRGILLKDILESGTDLSQNEKGYALTARYNGAVAWNTIERSQRTMVAEPIRIGDIGSNSQAHRVYSAEGKSVTINAGGGGQGGKTGLYACPIEAPAILRYERTEEAKKVRKDYESGKVKHGFHELHELHPRADGKSNTLSTVQKDNMLIEGWDGKTYPVYEVKNGLIEIKGKTYPIKLQDGFYIIRKLTVNECRRLQTIPDWYKMPCSASQNYKMLGNGWTIEVIKHILSHIPNIANCTVEVLSMYDGMSCGQIALTELGCKIDRYVSYEIDKYAIQTTKANFPQTEQRGDAFQGRQENWKY
jgi:site-specific DNA-cytosine methylase